MPLLYRILGWEGTLAQTLIFLDNKSESWEGKWHAKITSGMMVSLSQSLDPGSRAHSFHWCSFCHDCGPFKRWQIAGWQEWSMCAPLWMLTWKPQRRCFTSLASAEGLPVGWDLLMGAQANENGQKERWITSGLIFLSTRWNLHPGNIFFFLTKIIWECFPGQNILCRLCAHSTCSRGLNWSFVPGPESLWSI